MRVCHSVQNVHLEITLVCFYDYTNEESSQVNHSPTPGLQREQGVHFFSSVKGVCLSYLSGSLGLRSDIIPTWKSLAGFGAVFGKWEWCTKNGRLLRKKPPNPPEFYSRRNSRAKDSLSTKVQVPANSLDMERIVCLNYFKAYLSDLIHLFRWNLSLTGFYIECSILSCVEGGYFMRRRGKMQTKGLLEAVMNQTISGELLR